MGHRGHNYQSSTRHSAAGALKKENTGNKEEKSRTEKDKDGAWMNALKGGGNALQ